MNKRLIVSWFLLGCLLSFSVSIPQKEIRVIVLNQAEVPNEVKKVDPEPKNIELLPVEQPQDLRPVVVDITYEHLGPAYEWMGKTPKGQKFMKDNLNFGVNKVLDNGTGFVDPAINQVLLRKAVDELLVVKEVD